MNNWTGYIAMILAGVMLAGEAAFAHDASDATRSVASNAFNTLNMTLPNTTQGPFWPPAAFMDKNGDFVVVGTLLMQAEDGTVLPMFNQAAIVSKDTVPPLDSDGREDFRNPFGAPYRIVRYLDLSEGSVDLGLRLYTNSFGPVEGNFGGGPRVPREGESVYNLNGVGIACPELFPSASQRYTYTRESLPLHKSPIAGFMGDGTTYDVDTGENLVSSEPVLDVRRNKPITLAEWLKADVRLQIKLINYDEARKAYTAARFKVAAKGLLPNSLFQVVLARSSFISDLGSPTSHLITDEDGAAQVSFTIDNPFPDPATDTQGLRIVGMGIGFKSDFATLGGCPNRLGPGVDTHAAVLSAADGTQDFTGFITVSP